MRRPEDLEMKPGNCVEEDGTYATLFDHHTRRKKDDAEEKAAKNTHGRPILILVVLLIFLFIGLGVLTGFLFISNKNMREEILQMNGSLSTEIQSILGTVKNMQDIQKESSSLSTEIQSILGAVKNMQDIQKESNSNVMRKVTEIESSLNRISSEVVDFVQKIRSIPSIGSFLSRRSRRLSGDELNDDLKASSLSVRRTYPDMD